jgi:hypothetical protein
MTSEQLMIKSKVLFDRDAIGYDENMHLTINDYDPSRINAGLLAKIQSL